MPRPAVLVLHDIVAMSVKVISLFLLILFVVCFNNTDERSIIAPEEDAELEKQLKLINKLPLRTIKIGGDTIDCIDMKHQLAFEHPLLKNHKIQMEPSFALKALLKSSNRSSPKQPLYEFPRVECPPGSIPVRRTTKEDLIRAESFSKSTSPSIDPSYVLVSMTINDTKYSSVNANFSIWNFKVAGSQISTAQLWVEDEPGDTLNSLQPGWINDGFHKTGCYDLKCPGFVQTDQGVFFGIKFPKYSSFGGPQYILSLKIIQDPQTKNWWLNVPLHDFNIGYWPAELFPELADRAKIVAWGGRSFPDVDGTYPPMGM